MSSVTLSFTTLTSDKLHRNKIKLSQVWRTSLINLNSIISELLGQFLSLFAVLDCRPIEQRDCRIAESRVRSQAIARRLLLLGPNWPSDNHTTFHLTFIALKGKLLAKVKVMVHGSVGTGSFSFFTLFLG